MLYLMSWSRLGNIDGMASDHKTRAVSYADEPSLSFSVDAARSVLVRRSGSCYYWLVYDRSSSSFDNLT